MRKFFVASLLAVLTAVTAKVLPAQGVTTGALSGQVTQKQSNAPMPGVRVRAVHLPSGTAYQAITRADGRYSIPGMRVGGPYTVTATTIGYAPQSQQGVTIQLGVVQDVRFEIVPAAVQLAAVSVTAQSAGVLSQARSGAATTVSRDALETLPTINRSINDFTKLTPQASGTSFAGQDTRGNNITLDGSYNNNAFGLGSQPGARTNVSPIPLDAIDQIQVNVAPFDVRQGNFVGAGVNAVTKSGTNTFSGSVYRVSRSQDNVGTSAGALTVNPGTFSFSQWGARLGGPIIKDKLFFFVNYETDENSRPGSLFTANSGSEPITGNKTRVLSSDLTTLSAFLKDKLGYTTGDFQGYPFLTPSNRTIAKLDFNANDNNKFSLRYNQLNSNTDVLASNSNAIGNGNRNSSTQALSFQNSNYVILENSKSLVGEWNSTHGNTSNNMIFGYTTNDESRTPPGGLFPIVDILNGGTTYTSFGTEAFTPFNELRYNTLQFQNNFTVNTEKHDVTFGVTAQRYRSENSFYSGSQSAYVYNSLQDFYTDVNDYIANPNRTTSPVTLNRFQLRYANIPGLDRPPLQKLDVLYAGAYVQDEFRVAPRFKLTLGLRVDVPKFKKTGAANSAVPLLAFRDEIGATTRYTTDQMPKATPLWSPRVGFNWNARGERSTQVRGGSGIFTGPPPYVWISNQIGQNGILSGFDNITNTTTRPFNPDPFHYAPTSVTGAPAASYELNVTNADYKFPQVWRTDIAVDQQLPWGIIGTVEYLYNQDVNGAYYINANLPAPTSSFGGPDQRPRWSTTANRINSNITANYVLKNQSVGSSYNISASLEKAFRGGLYAKAAYAYGSARNTVDPGSTAAGNFNGNFVSTNPNAPNVAYSSNWSGHRAFLVMSYKKQYFGFGATGISVFNELRSLGNASYAYPGDFNGDGANNDLIYVAKNLNEMNFTAYSVTAAGAVTTTASAIARTFSAAEQATAWNSFINQDPYLSKRRGQYAERGAVFLPTVFRSDLSLTQDLFGKLAGQQNKFQFRVDILNVGNLINKNWGGAQRLVTTNPLVVTSPATLAAGGLPTYRLANVGTSLIKQSFQRTSNVSDVWSMQFGFRYIFN